MEASRAVSSGVDRTIKIWDLGRGFCKNGFLCAPLTLPEHRPVYDLESLECTASLCSYLRKTCAHLRSHVNASVCQCLKMTWTAIALLAQHTLHPL